MKLYENEEIGPKRGNQRVAGKPLHPPIPQHQQLKEWALWGKCCP